MPGMGATSKGINYKIIRSDKQNGQSYTPGHKPQLSTYDKGGRVGLMGALRGLGRAYQAYKKSKEASKALKSSKKTNKLQFPVIKSVPVSKTVTQEGVEASVKKTKSDAYLKNIDEVNKHRRNIHKGEEAAKKLEDMVDTKKAYKIGKTSVHPRDPGKKKQIGAD